MIETIILCSVFGVFLILAFIIGARVGQKIVKGEEVKVDVPHPVEAIKEHLEKKKIEKEQSRIEIMMNNIDNYDGTALGQKEIPK